MDARGKKELNRGFKDVQRIDMSELGMVISFLTVLLMYGTLSLTVLFYHLQWQVLNINCRHLT